MTDDESRELAWETLDGHVAYACPGFDVRHEEVRLPDGTETDFDYLSEPEAVVVLPFTRAGDVVVIDEWRQAVKRVNRGLPVGTVEPGDGDLAAAARRELREETGYEAERVAPLVTVEPANGVADSVHNYFVARGCEPAAGQDLDFDESIRPTTVAYGALREAVRDGDVRDGRAVLAVLYYELFGAEE
ncbi:NUDIX hydrolase [Halomarina pelagica]|uniref:NUDIX hydrolase n=1 Tax=Halomarina pelagica TaxID=2961599 RepID=UPI0020C336EB|nr:NUDIX hydrolase [Halomarina sp. BND7]